MVQYNCQCRHCCALTLQDVDLDGGLPGDGRPARVVAGVQPGPGVPDDQVGPGLAPEGLGQHLDPGRGGVVGHHLRGRGRER